MDEAPSGPSSGHYAVPGFRLLRLLGEGGMGQVHLARDLALGRLVAIKFVSDRGPEESGSYERFLREARVMATLEHPHIVRIHALAEAGEGHAIVMQYVSGQSLARRLIDTPQLELLEALRITLECVRGLGAASRQGIVHRDLKPSNILLDEDGCALVADFGLAHDMRRQGGLLEFESDALLCTPHYASPEQLRDDPALDLRSDIYSLGLVLYEMLTGERPYTVLTPLEVVRAKLEQAPPDLASARPDLPAEVPRIVSWMTARERAERPDSIDELERSLVALLASADQAKSSPPQPGEWEPTPVATSKSMPPNFVCRDRELALLQSAFEESVQGACRVVLIHGEAGTGKSALVAAFVRRVIEESPEALFLGTGCSPAGDEPYAPFRDGLVLLTGDVAARVGEGPFTQSNMIRLIRASPQVLQSLVNDGPDLVDSFVPGDKIVRVARLNGVPESWVSYTEARLASRPTGPAQPPDRQGLFDQYCRVLESVAQEHPLVLVIDDLHWADEGSIALLMHLVQQLRATPLLLLACYRGSEVALGRDGSRHPLGSAINEIQRRPIGRSLALEERAELAFVEALIDCQENRLDADFRRSLHARTMGHALFTVELLESLKARDTLRRDEDGAWVTDDALDWGKIPARVEATISERVERLPAPERRLLSVASVEGPSFSAEIAARFAGIDRDEAVRLLSEELASRHGLVVAQGLRYVENHQVLSYRFTHVLFQRHVYESLDEVQRALLHHEVGESLEDRHEQGRAQVAVELARHFDRAGESLKAIDYYDLAGGEARRISAFTESIVSYRRAIALSEEQTEPRARKEKTLHLLLSITAPLFARNGWTDTEVGETLQTAGQLANEIGTLEQRVGVGVCLMAHLTTKIQIRQALPLARRTEELARELGDSHLLFESRTNLATCVFHAGECREARLILEGALADFDLESAGEVPNATGVDTLAGAYSWLASVLWLSGEPELAAEQMRLANARAAAVEQVHTWLITHLHSIFLLLVQGDLAGAQAHLSHAEELGQEREMVYMLSMFRHLRAGVAALQGRFDEARGEMQAAAADMAAVGAPDRQLFMFRDRAEVAAALGRFDEGLALIDEAVAISTRTGDQLWASDLHRVRALLLLGRSQGAEAMEAERCLRHARDLARAQGAGFPDLRAAAELAQFLAKSGRSDEALAEVDAALKLYPGQRNSPLGRGAQALATSLR